MAARVEVISLRQSRAPLTVWPRGMSSTATRYFIRSQWLSNAPRMALASSNWVDPGAAKIEMSSIASNASRPVTAASSPRYSSSVGSAPSTPSSRMSATGSGGATGSISEPGAGGQLPKSASTMVLTSGASSLALIAMGGASGPATSPNVVHTPSGDVGLSDMGP